MFTVYRFTIYLYVNSPFSGSFNVAPVTKMTEQHQFACLTKIKMEKD